LTRGHLVSRRVTVPDRLYLSIGPLRRDLNASSGLPRVRSAT
jgi:hypothetical protein